MKKENREIYLCCGTRMLGAEWQSEDSKMFQFLSIFHPEIPLAKRLELARTCNNSEYKVHLM